MSILIPVRDQFVGIFALQCFIDSLSTVFRSINNAIRRCSILYTLIPDCCDPRAPIRKTKHRICIIDPCINKSNQYPIAFEREHWLILKPQNTGCLQCRHIQKPIAFGDTGIGVSGDIERRQPFPRIIKDIKIFCDPLHTSCRSRYFRFHPVRYDKIKIFIRVDLFPAICHNKKTPSSALYSR